MIKRSKIEEEILEEYLKSHRNISDRQLRRVKKAIKDIDIRTYEKLAEYDRSSGVTNKRKSYLNIMLKNYRKKYGESTASYNKRVHNEKKRLLERSGIDTTRHFTFKGFSKGLDFGGIKVKNKKAVKESMRNEKKKILKSPKKFISDYIDRLKPSKSKIHLKAPKGFFNKLKNWKENNPTKFKEYRIKALIAVALITLSFSAINNIKNPTNSPTSYIEITNDDVDSSEIDNSEVETSIDSIEDLEDSVELDIDEEELEITDSTGGSSETEITDETEEITVDEELEISDNNESTINYISASSAIHSLVSNSNIGFNTEFQMQYGLYYETPEETGTFGRYINFEGSNLKLTYIDAIYEDGRVVQYNASSGLSIADIIEQNEGATLSYHVETTDGNILGWNSSTSNNIEASLLLGHINQLQSYISSEDMEFLNSIDFRNITEISEDNVEKISEIIQTAQNTLNRSSDEQIR